MSIGSMRSFKEIDWSDYLSPILVKELRQGLRSKAFVWSFLLLQGLMIIAVVFSLLAPSGTRGQELISAGFWIMISIPILLIPDFPYGY